jgi:histidine phosphotransferase ChpT
LLPKNQVKLLLNLLVLATQAVRAAAAAVSRATVEGEQGTFEITATGLHARIPAHVEELLAGRSETGTIDAHAVQPLYAGMVARAAEMGITFAIEGDTVTIKPRRPERSRLERSLPVEARSQPIINRSPALVPAAFRVE